VAAGAGQPVAVRPPLEQPGAEGLLELSQMPHHGGLAQAQRPRRAAQAARLSQGEEHAQIVPLHAASLSSGGAPDPERGAPSATAPRTHPVVVSWLAKGDSAMDFNEDGMQVLHRLRLAALPSAG